MPSPGATPSLRSLQEIPRAKAVPQAWKQELEKETQMVRILVIGGKDSDAELLRTAFREAGLPSESANSITAGREAAGTGRFQVVFFEPYYGRGIVEAPEQIGV